MEEIEIQNNLKNLPDLPGVYRYYDSNEKLLYVGKAKNLKKRVRSYFQKNDHTSRINLMIKQISRIEFSIVKNEKDAFLLENNLIKTLKPKYNIELRDDKTYPYIKIINERFPRVIFTRKYINDGSEYFGPYTAVNDIKAILDLIKKLFATRNCSLNLSIQNIEAQKHKVCLEYHIKNCLAPCVGFQTEEDYTQKINQIKKILKGQVAEVKNILTEEMLSYATNLEFENAENSKQKINALQEYIIKSNIINRNLGNFHVFGYSETDTKAFIQYFYIYEGSIVQSKMNTVLKKLDEDKNTILVYVILNTLNGKPSKDDILVPFEIEEKINNYTIVCPKIGDKKYIVDLAQKNTIYKKHEKEDNNTKEDKTNVILQLMQKELKLNQLPIHIECFDNSNFQGTNPVSACVVFKNAKPSKKDYRHFNVKTVIGANDFDTMKEVVFRRYSRLLEENQTLPQLIIIDGGKGQLSAAIESLEKLNIQDKVQIISLAKRLEEIYYPNDTLPLHINKKSTTLKIIQQLRDEAHRFGITFHRLKRSKHTFKTELTEINGIGEELSKKLLNKFKSIQKIKTSTIEDIGKIIGTKKATEVYNYFQKKTDN